MNAAKPISSDAAGVGPEPVAFCGVSRGFGQILALNELSVTVGSGITGLVGPNGAGKTTFINLLVGMLRPSQGTVRVFGADPWEDASARAKVGYCPDGERLWDWMTGVDIVATLGVFSGMTQADAKSAATGALACLDMGSASLRPAREYSKGMRQKVKLAQAMIHRPSLLVLDEPLNGVDPLSRVQILSKLRDLAAAGTAVLVSSHVLHELDVVADQVVLIHRGRLLARGPVADIRTLMDEHPHTVRLVTPKPRHAARALVGIDGVVGIQIRDDETLDALTRNPSAVYAALPSITLDEGIPIRSVSSPDSGLEAVFRYLVKEDSR